MSESPGTQTEVPFGRFFLPGPTEVHPDVLAAQTRPMISHRGAEVKELMAELQTGMEEVFCTSRPVFISTSSATGFMEAAVRNAGRERVLSLVNGAFSKRFADIARSCGFEVDEVEIPWGEAHDPDQVRAALANGSYDAVTMAHSETSTSVLNDVESLASAIRDSSDALVLVDSVSGFGAGELRPDDWGLDFVLTGSQKAFALPPGLSFGVASERMMERAAGAPRRGFYFDLTKFQSNWEKQQSPTTPAISVLYSLQVQLDRMRAEGMEARWKRHSDMAGATWTWVGQMRERGVALSLAAPDGFRSPAVTAIHTPEGVSGPDVTAAARERGVLIGGGYGKWKPTSFRIGHMGEHTLEETELVLAIVEDVLR